MSQIVIIGAGASGLMAANILLRKGHAVTIVEARDRTGGRIHTLQGEFSKPVDAGAEFIHGDQPITLSLLKDARVKKTLLKGAHYSFYGGAIHEGDLLDEQWTAFSNELKKLNVDTDLASFLKKHFDGDEWIELRQRVKGFAQGFDLADITRASSLTLREEWLNSDEEHQYHIPGGYQKLLDVLETQVRESGGVMLTSTEIQEIRWRKGNVRLITRADNTIYAEKIILTVSVGVLQKGLIRFDPESERHQKAFQHIGFGGVIKFLFEFNEPFWKDTRKDFKDLSFVYSDADIPTWWTQLPDKIPLLTGWLGGPPATFEHNADALFQKSLRSLAYIFNTSSSAIESHIRTWHIADWTKDPFSFGAYTYPTLTTDAAKKVLTEPIEETIYFAGEGLYTGDALGTVEAALTSGKNTAERIGN